MKKKIALLCMATVLSAQLSFAGVSYSDYKVTSNESSVYSKAVTSGNQLMIPLEVLSKSKQKLLQPKAKKVNNKYYLSREVLAAQGYKVEVDPKKKTVKVTAATATAKTAAIESYIWENGRTFISPQNRPYQFKDYVKVISKYNGREQIYTSKVSWDLSTLKKEVGTYTVYGNVNNNPKTVSVKIKVIPPIKAMDIVVDEAIYNVPFALPKTMKLPLQDGSFFEVKVDWLDGETFMASKIGTFSRRIYVSELDETFSATVIAKHPSGISNRVLLQYLEKVHKKKPEQVTQEEVDSWKRIHLMPEEGDNSAIKELKAFRNLEYLALTFSDNESLDLSSLKELNQLDSIKLAEPNQDKINQVVKYAKLKNLIISSSTPQKIDFKEIVKSSIATVTYQPSENYTDHFEDVKMLYQQNRIALNHSITYLEAMNTARQTNNTEKMSELITQEQALVYNQKPVQVATDVSALPMPQVPVQSVVIPTPQAPVQNVVVAPPVIQTPPAKVTTPAVAPTSTSVTPEKKMITVTNPSVLDRFRTVYDIKSNQISQTVADEATYLSIENPQAGLDDLKYFPKLEILRLDANEQPLDLSALKNRHLKELQLYEVTDAVLKSIGNGFSADTLSLNGPNQKTGNLYQALDLSVLYNAPVKQINLGLGLYTNDPQQLRMLFDKKILSPSKTLTTYFENNEMNLEQYLLKAYDNMRTRYRPIAEAEASRVVARIIQPSMTEEQKIKTLYEYLTQSVTYNREAAATYYRNNRMSLEKWKQGLQSINQNPYLHPEYPVQLNLYYDFYKEPYSRAYTPYGALIEKNAVCSGVAEALYLLAKSAGLESYYVSGTSQGEGHAWAIVRVNGIYRHYDATWDLGGKKSYYQLTDDQIKKDHEWRASDYPACR